MAFSLLACVRSEAGRRSAPRNCVPIARSSYTAQASYIHVCTIASARDTAGAPSFASRAPCTAARLQLVRAFRAAGTPVSAEIDTRTHTSNNRSVTGTNNLLRRLDSILDYLLNIALRFVWKMLTQCCL